MINRLYDVLFLEIPFEMQGLLSSASVIGKMNFVKTKESQLVSDPVAFGNIHFFDML